MRLSSFAWLCVLACGCGGGKDSADASVADAAVDAHVATNDLGKSPDGAPPGDAAFDFDADVGHVPMDAGGGDPLPDLAAPLMITSSPIPYPDTRKAEMAAYSLAHYGNSTSALAPKQIVLHFTATATYSPVWNLFSQDTPNRGELPGTCSQYVVDKDGTVHQLVDETIRCRHTVGLDHVALGIEMVQETGSGATWADAQILARPAQIDAVLHLVKWLQAKYGIATADVIGHAMANSSPYFVDLEGWTNDHTDWQAADVTTFRARLDALP